MTHPDSLSSPPQRSIWFGALACSLLSTGVSLRRCYRGYASPPASVIAALALDVPFKDVGLEPGDVVYSVNSIPTPTVRQLRAVLEGVGLGDPAVFRIDRRGRFMYVALNLE